MRRYFQQLIDGVQYCHQEGVVHGELGMEYLLLDGSIYSPDLNIIGFGYVKRQRGQSECTPAYVTPELVLGPYHVTTRYDGKAMDVWACGVILFKMLTGTFPYANGFNVGLNRKMMRDMAAGRVHYPQEAQVSSLARELIKMVLNPDPKQRVTLEQIREHEWVTVAGTPKPRTPKKIVGAVSSQSCEEIERVVRCTRNQPSPASCIASGPADGPNSLQL